jgi:hypothetical protein
MVLEGFRYRISERSIYGEILGGTIVGGSKRTRYYDSSEPNGCYTLKKAVENINSNDIDVTNGI